MSDLEQRVEALERVLAGELPAHLRAAWPAYEAVLPTMRLPQSDPRSILELRAEVRPTGLLLRLQLNNYLVVWEREVFFAER